MSGGKCVVCGSSDRLSCHEAWKFNEAKGIQKLFRLESRCGICHFVEHLGMAESLARQGELDFNAVIQHFCKVNRCDVGHFLSHRERAAARWIKRSRKTWKINFGKYDALLPTTAKGPHKPFDPAEAFIVKNAGPKQERAQKSKRGKL